MQEKRGLSQVITTLIIILLVLVAVGGIWVVVNNFIQTGSEQIELGKFTLDLQIKSVNVLGDDVTVTIVVRRNPGKGELVGMNFIFSDGQNSEVVREDTVLKEFEEKTFTFTLAEVNTSNLKDVSVAPIYELSSGKEEAGNVADMFNIKEGSITGGVVKEISNFEALGYKGVGKREYGPFSSDVLKLPEFRRAIVDPLDVLPGDNQTFTVHVYSPSGVVGVTSMTELDNSTLNLNFLKVSEYEESGETIEIWTITWVVDDVHTTTYRTTIIAIDAGGNENSITLTWTDSCQTQLTHGGADTLTSSCSTGSLVDGLDGGNLIVQTGVTLTIDTGGVWAFNSGTSITVDGTITVNGEIKKGNLYYTDADGDGHGPNAVLAFGSGGVRAKDSSGTTDCNDANPAGVFVWWEGYGKDDDGDGYGRTAFGCNNGANPFNNTLGLDCYDLNANAKPGQTLFFSVHRGDNSFDYNCDGGTETKQNTAVSSQCDTCTTFGCGGLDCCESVAGSTGWVLSSSADCGVTANFINDAGECAFDSSPGMCANDAPVTCNNAGASKTQSCR